ncbi:hypothetical protein [Sphingomicrobium sediminis]|uniref:Uncharacterized protein n=1 Tax=Sphingomicrobium sediminis TaxID=2950949 RepID=A0A9X2EHG7_9SPHN|nr:hypothetical protein [Sphingomicrobium sediminis]MCM8558118.1 hypothetical protein [Sphingomicrobium sediminis]
MFKAARDQLLKAGHRLAASWRDLRGRGMVGLFVFELVVVTLGVLLAQAAAGWAEDRRDVARMEGVHDRLKIDLGNALWFADVWQTVGPCLSARVDELIRVAGSDGYPSEDQMVRPTLFIMSLRSVPAEDEVLMRRIYGNDYVGSIAVIDQSIRMLLDESDIIGGLWLTFDLLDRANGEVRDGDRVAARHDAARIRSALARISNVEKNIRAESAKIGITQPANANYRSPRDCNELWDEGAIAVLKEPS